MGVLVRPPTRCPPRARLTPSSLPRIDASRDATVNELAEPFAMTQQAVSRHVKVLERAGLISRARTAQFRPCRLEPARLDTAAEWIARHRQMWDERYDRMDELPGDLARRTVRTGRRAGPQPDRPKGFSTSLDRYEVYLATLTGR